MTCYWLCGFFLTRRETILCLNEHSKYVGEYSGDVIDQTIEVDFTLLLLPDVLREGRIQSMSATSKLRNDTNRFVVSL